MFRLTLIVGADIIHHVHQLMSSIENFLATQSRDLILMGFYNKAILTLVRRG
jgi:hypothetical protein